MNGSVRQIMWVGVAAFWIFVAGLAFQWTVSRVYVPEGKSLLLRYKGSLLFGRSNNAPPGASPIMKKVKAACSSSCGGLAAISTARSGGNAHSSKIWSCSPDR